MTNQKHKSLWKPVIIGWTLYAVFMSTQSYVVNIKAGRQFIWQTLLFSEVLYAAGWALLTPVIVALARRFPLGRLAVFRNFFVHLFLSFGVAVAHKFLHGIVLAMFRLYTEGTQFSWDNELRGVIGFFDYGIPLYWIIILLHYGYEYYGRYQEKALRAAQLETQLAQAQLQALKMQLHPHFLFNTLNAISVLIQKDPGLARRTVSRLSDLLRYSLDNMEALEVPLRQELDFLERYLQIEQTRFGDRLTVKIQVPEDVKDAAVPNMILQPLVENAIKHGISRRRGAAQIEITARRCNGTLELVVRDNGAGLGGNESKDGIGLSSTRTRLSEMYGTNQSFTLHDVPDGGAEARMIIPCVFHELAAVK